MENICRLKKLYIHPGGCSVEEGEGALCFEGGSTKTGGGGGAVPHYDTLAEILVAVMPVCNHTYV